MATRKCQVCGDTFTTGGWLATGGFRCTNPRCGIEICGPCTKGVMNSTCPKCGYNAKQIA